MRVGLSTSVIQRGQTGIAQHVFALVRALGELPVQPQLFLFCLEEDRPLFSFAAHQARLIPVPEAFRPPLMNIFWHQTILPRLARELQLDVLHIPSYRRLLWPRPCPLVATIHDLAPFRVPKKYDWMRMIYGRHVVARLIWRQDKVIAISHNTARDIRQFFHLPAEKISVIGNGVDHERFFPGSRDAAKTLAAQRYGLRGPFFLYVARLEHPGKNHVRLIAAFNRFKNETKSSWQLVLAGGDWHGAAAIHEAIQQSPFATDIRRLGFVPDADIPDLHRAAEVFVYPSLYEGFGLPPIEAMACGCPVLSSTRGALAEVVGDAAATVDPEDTLAIEWQMARLAADPDLRERLRSAGLARAREFDWRKNAASTMAVYARAASSPKPSRTCASAVIDGEPETPSVSAHPGGPVQAPDRHAPAS